MGTDAPSAKADVGILEKMGGTVRKYAMRAVTPTTNAVQK